MRTKNRELILKMVVVAVVGLFLLDWMILSPLIAHWGEQTERITQLREKVARGRQLIERERAIRERWAEMAERDLPDNVSEADNEVFKGVSRWAAASRASFTSLAPNWRTHDEGYETYECRATATGDQASLSRLLFEMERDNLPARVEEVEFTTRDKTGKQLLLTARFSFLRLTNLRATPR
jgi:hypothetical protein